MGTSTSSSRKSSSKSGFPKAQSSQSLSSASVSNSPARAARSSSIMMLASPVGKILRRNSLALDPAAAASNTPPLVRQHKKSQSSGAVRRPTRLIQSTTAAANDGLDDDNNMEMTSTEAAFLPRDVRERVSQFVNGMLPPAPAMFPKPGAAMFVDISGFTALGEKLRLTSEGSKEAAEELSRQITNVLNDLTRICIQCGGDVAKYAGDALLCTFQGGDEDECLVRAQNCAVDMLMSMRRYNQTNETSATPLQIHGGIAKGTIMHLHLGSSDDELRWYLVAGDAVASAVTLVDRALPGQVLLSPNGGLLSPNWSTAKQVAIEGRAFGNLAISKPHDPDLVLLLHPITEEDTATLNVDIPLDSINGDISVHVPPATSRKTLVAPQISFKTRKTNEPAFQSGEQPIEQQQPPPTPKSRAASSSINHHFGIRTSMDTEEGNAIELFVLDADTSKAELVFASAAATSTAEALVVPSHVLAVKGSNSVYDLPLHASGCAYIPKSLRASLRTGFDASEMRNRVGVVFVGLPYLALTDSELCSSSIPGVKLDALNQAFVKMTRVSHSFQGEIRDLLFDDKGCIFIAVFGAYTTSEMSELKACKCAMAISQEFPRSKVGVSAGMCFVGMCGSSKRHDFIVMGHEVNIAARCMVVAQEGQVLVSPEVERETRELIQYEKVPFHFNKKQQQADDDAGGFVFKANSQIARRPSFLALYRYGLRDRDLFVGRQEELARMEHTILRMVYGEDPVFTAAAASAGLRSALSKKHGVSTYSLLAAAAAEPPPTPTQMVDKNERADSGVILLEAPAGMGKSAFVSRVKKFGKGRLIIASTAAFSLEQDNEFFVFRHLLESYTGFRRDMNLYQLRRIANEDYGGEDTLDFDVLSDVIPWMRGVMKINASSKQHTSSGGGAAAAAKPALTSDRMDKIGREVIKLLMGFRGELTISQLLEGESTKGVLLVIEDVQWMDIASLRLLKYLLVHLDKLKGLVFLLTSRLDKRDEEAAAVVAAQQQLPNDRQRLIRQVLELAKPPSKKAAASEMLQGLTQADTYSLVALLLKVDESQVSDEVKDFVFQRTQGYPMYIVSLMEWIRERELLVVNANNGGIYEWADDKRDTSRFPNTLADTMLAKFDALDVQTRNLLKIATVLGTEFDAIKLTTLANIDLAKTTSSQGALTEDSVLDSLAKAKDQGVLTMVKSRGVRREAYIWRFKHDTMLQAVQSIIPAERNEQLQQLIKPMSKVVENKKLLPLFAGFLGEVDDDDDE